jgi:hypothetical protein
MYAPKRIRKISRLKTKISKPFFLSAKESLHISPFVSQRPTPGTPGRLVIDHYQRVAIRPQPGRRQKTHDKAMDGVDEMGVSQQPLANLRSAQPTLDLLARRIGVRKHANPLSTATPVTTKDGKLGNHQGGLAAPWACRYIERIETFEKRPPWLIQIAQRHKPAHPFDVCIRDWRN